MSGTSGNHLREALKRSVDVFRVGRVPHVLIGAWALAVWGRPRATLDVDFLVLVDEAELGSLGARMTRLGMRLDEHWLEWNPMLRGHQLRLHFHDVAIDLLRPRDQYDRQVFNRRRRKRFEGRYYWVVAPDDFILQKLKVGRPRDFEDALTVLERSKGELDHAYLRRWARRLGLSRELEYVMAL